MDRLRVMPITRARKGILCNLEVNIHSKYYIY